MWYNSGRLAHKMPRAKDLVNQVQLNEQYVPLAENLSKIAFHSHQET